MASMAMQRERDLEQHDVAVGPGIILGEQPFRFAINQFQLVSYIDYQIVES